MAIAFVPSEGCRERCATEADEGFGVEPDMTGLRNYLIPFGSSSGLGMEMML